MALPESSPRSARSHDSRSPIIRRTRPIQDLYNVTRRIDTNNDELSLFYLFVGYDPLIFEEAYRDEKWPQAMNEEIHAINKNNTWELTTLPEDHQAIGVKWIFEIKKMQKER